MVKGLSTVTPAVSLALTLRCIDALRPALRLCILNGACIGSMYYYYYYYSQMAHEQSPI